MSRHLFPSPPALTGSQMHPNYTTQLYEGGREGKGGRGGVENGRVMDGMGGRVKGREGE